MRLLGVVENMSSEVFGSGGGDHLAQQLKVPLLGRVPLGISLRGVERRRCAARAQARPTRSRRWRSARSPARSTRAASAASRRRSSWSRSWRGRTPGRGSRRSASVPKTSRCSPSISCGPAHRRARAWAVADRVARDVGDARGDRPAGATRLGARLRALGRRWGTRLPDAVRGGEGAVDRSSGPRAGGVQVCSAHISRLVPLGTGCACSLRRAWWACLRRHRRAGCRLRVAGRHWRARTHSRSASPRQTATRSCPTSRWVRSRTAT